MEHGVDVPLMGEFELIGHWRDDSNDREGSMTSGGQFDCTMRQR